MVEPDEIANVRRPSAAWCGGGRQWRFSGHPLPGDTLLVVEVAESSLDFDRQVKMPLYARQRILEAWLVDLQHETVTVYRDPSADGYRTVQTVRPGEILAPLAFPERTFAVAALFGLE